MLPRSASSQTSTSGRHRPHSSTTAGARWRAVRENSTSRSIRSSFSMSTPCRGRRGGGGRSGATKKAVKPAASTTGSTPPEAKATSWPAAAAARAIGASGSKWPRPPMNVNRARTRQPYGIVHLLVNDPFKALAHPIRRGIVERLAHGPATVKDATVGFGVSKPAISKHLKVLEESGVVSRVVDGRNHRLSLDRARWTRRPTGWTSAHPLGAPVRRRRRLPQGGPDMNAPRVVSPEEWEAAWQEMLSKEKAHTRARDALAAERRRCR